MNPTLKTLRRQMLRADYSEDIIREADDEDMIRNAHRVLAAFGDERPARAVDAVCWADFEEEEARRAAGKDKEAAE